MVNNDVMIGIASDVVVTLPAYRHTAAYPDVAYDDIMGVDVEGTGNANTVTGSRLSGYGNVGMIDVEVTVNFDGAGNAEYYNTRSFGFESCPQAAFAVVVEIGNGYHFAAAATAGKHTATPGTGEGRNNAFG
jgi:hypothetical protein